MGSFWIHFGVTLGTLCTYRRGFACLMHIISPYVRSKRAQKQKVLIFAKDFAFQGSHEGSGAGLRGAEPDRLGGGRGRVNPPPRKLVWRFWRFGGLVTASTRFEAKGLGGLISIALIVLIFEI